MDETVVFLCCARNCAKYINNSINNIHKIGWLFKDYKIFIYENDSTDETTEIVNNYNKQDKFICIIEKNITNKIPSRTWRLAYARNCLSKKLQESKYNPDYVIIMDLDDIGANNCDRGIEFIKNSIKLKEHWDGIFPSLTYDIWAFRKENFMINSWDFGPAGRPKTINYQKVLRAHMNEITPDKNGLIPVYSCFGGIGIYKYNTYIKGVYCGKNIHFRITGTNPEDCEHVTFHKSLGCCRLMMFKNLNYHIIK